MKKIVANMVGRNEAGNYLKRVLARVASQVDLITFTDDASEDDTAAIAESFGALVNRVPTPTFRTNEGKLRQNSWEYVGSKLDPAFEWWVLAIDCDEMLYETETPMRELIEQNDYDVINITFFHMWNEDHFRFDKAWKPHGSTRLFKYYPGGTFLDRALACGSEPTYVQSFVQQRRYMVDSGLFMKHLSYIEDDDKMDKYKRYAEIDGGAFHANAHIESILDKDPTLMPWVWGGGGPE